MKKTVLLFALAFYSMVTFGQDNLDNIWIFGYSSGSPAPAEIGRTVIDFNTIPPDIFKGEGWGEMDFRSFNASICNEEGELQFYSNGLAIANKEHVWMENGGGINPGQFHDDMLGFGYMLWQGGIVLPEPGKEDRYYLFHADREYSTPELGSHSPHLYGSLVDMSENGGIGKVVVKNVAILSDTLSLGKLTATRHGNGRDWWIIFHEFASNRYYSILVTPTGIFNLGLEEEGLPIPDEGLGQAVFSPDGRFYARLNSVSVEEGQFLDIYEFDRCSGLLSEHVQIIYNDTAYAAGIAISPNSQFLYVSSYNHLYQYDLYSDDVGESGTKVATYDGFLDGQLTTRFYLAQLAPNGKIYLNMNNSTQYLHVIHQPDRPCPNCGIEQHGIYLPTYNAFSMPNFPNFRLGPLDGSPCDTLGLDNVPVAKFRYQQDTADYLRIEFTDLSFYEPAEWHWDFGDNATSSSKHTARKYATEGAYEVCLTVSNNNGSDTHCETISVGTVATEEEMPEVGITVFPNPAHEGVNVILQDGYLPKAGSITLYDSIGRPQLSQKVIGGWNSLRLDGLVPGIYFYEVRDGEVLLGSGKLVVE